MKEEQILKIIASVLNINFRHLSIESNYCNTNGWDSMATTNIIVALEEEFDIDIDIDDAEKFVNTKNIIRILEEKYI